MSSRYIDQIRTKIGNDFLLLPSVTVLVYDAQKRVLLVRHHLNNLWVAPGGMIEPDESPESAALREMEEEIGCQVRITNVLGSFGGSDFRMRYQNGDEVGYVMTVYEAILVSGEIKPDGVEILEARFFSFEEIENLQVGRWLPQVLQDVLRKLQ